MSTNYLLLLCVVITIVMSLFCGAFGITSSFNIEDEIDEPEEYDVLTFIGGGFLGLLTFSISDMPSIFSVFFWLLLLIETYCVVRLIRGVA